MKKLGEMPEPDQEELRRETEECKRRTLETRGQEKEEQNVNLKEGERRRWGEHFTQKKLCKETGQIRL